MEQAYRPEAQKISQWRESGLVRAALRALFRTLNNIKEQAIAKGENNE